MIRVSGYEASGAAGRVWRIAVLTASGAIVGVSQADAALYYYSDSGYYSRPEPMVSPRRQKASKHQAKKTQAAEKESSKPQGPLIIAISIEKQKLRIYDANGFFAETPISTGMKGHPTPMGVFSVIQKHKFHHSNIYSGAPMPYMQRITWSGVAMHAGVLPGYPASHGCIRMPMAFAVKMWNWTKMGARVVVTPGEMTPPSGFSHPLLVAQKVAPQPTTEPQADAPPAPKSDKASDAGTSDTSTISVASLELRPTVGHVDGAKGAMGGPSARTSLREQTHTADAGSDMPAAATMNDAAPRAADNAVSAEAAEASKPDTKPEASSDMASEAKPLDTAVAESKPSEESRPAETATSDDAGKKSDETAPAVQASGDGETAATGSLKTETKVDEKQETRPEAKPEDVKAEASPEALKAGEKASEKPSEKHEDPAKAATDVGAGDARKDQARWPDTAKPAAKPDPAQAAPKRTGQLAVFVSRKDQKLYVRQNFAPLFDVPVTIAASDRPLGTHVFTAQLDKVAANIVHWSVISLPASRRATRHDEDERVTRKRKMAGAVEIKDIPTPDSPTEALDRLTIPAEAMARITEALSTGGSIIVSDQGINQGETGEGTDFIVSLR